VDPAHHPKGSPVPPNLEALTGRLLLQRYVPSAVLVGPEGDILFSSGRTGKYLEPAVGAANLNILAMARPGLDILLNEAFHRALREPGPVVVRQAKVGTNGGTQFVDVTLELQREAGPLKGKVMIIFMDVPAPQAAPEPGSAGAGTGASPDEELEHAREALKLAQAELNTTREDMQISREELNSTNEELQSINEELQSTNEELTTSKEEMQSMNEELQTVNHELQAKVDELSTVNNDLKNLLNSTDIATLFLDEAFCIRRFTTQAAKIIRLLPGDLGRPITDITTLLVYPELAEDARGVLETLIFKERQVIALDQRWFNVRIMPYRTVENRIDGVVITFADVTVAHALEEALRVAAAENDRLRQQQNGSLPSVGAEPQSLP
jgi:two-component system CheB/CheR fusion protein